MKLKVWMSTPDAQDMDVFVAVRKLYAYGDLIGFPFYAVFEDGPVALGWLRASHRELDQERSRPWQQVLAHRRELPLAAGRSSRWRSRSCRPARCSGRARRCGSSSRAGTCTATRGR